MPEPSLYSPIGTPFIELPSVDSTNNYALASLHAGLAQHGFVFFTREQVAGRGQMGKSWLAEKDSSLILSAIINPQPIPLEQQFQLSACVAVSTVEFFSRYAGADTRIKWPNDIYWQDRKAGGILIESIIGGLESGVRSRESEAGSQTWKWAVAGIGININQPKFSDALKNPVSLRQICGREFIASDLARELCTVLEKNWQLLVNKGFDSIYTAYLNLLYKKNKAVKLKIGARVFEGTIKYVSPQGKLVVEHGIEEEFNHGELEWLIPDS